MPPRRCVRWVPEAEDWICASCRVLETQAVEERNARIEAACVAALAGEEPVFDPIAHARLTIPDQFRSRPRRAPAIMNGASVPWEDYLKGSSSHYGELPEMIPEEH